MPSDPSITHFPADALDAFLEGLRSELSNPADPTTLARIRTVFRKRIPFHMRSYAAALLIMRAAGLSRGAPSRAMVPSAEAEPPARPSQERPPAGTAAAPRQDRKPKEPARPAGPPARSGALPVQSRTRPSGAPEAKEDAAPRRRRNETVPPRITRSRSVAPAAGTVSGDESARTGAVSRTHAAAHSLEGPSTPLFVSMGRRQRLRASEVRELFLTQAGLGENEVGQVRLFDNYCFVDIASDRAQSAIEATDGRELRGRRIAVGPAKPRSDGSGETPDHAAPAESDREYDGPDRVEN